MTIEATGATNSAEDIALCAINTGELYRAHLELARRNASDEKWLVHVLLYVMPVYRKAALTTEHANAETVARVACELRDYYKQHVAEF